ncbi:uncharacterized protein N7484_006742 [Penicillium longicatenatum]|uniref:uncharacterized protein n=1 Tax=Penicillium longicatenatum TaxID=1561947 RepID=UPI0025467906|nr:uncharacterized protein N7484_006742 [Penicillium longicatenatum]KAJ5644235.1 hypothetical protein N7484_006742 [Penicillium longicatenatum]
MDKGPHWITPSALPSILELADEDGIDIVHTEDESESEYSQTESDRVFVVPDEGSEATGDNEYEPPEIISTTSSDEEDDEPAPEILGQRQVVRRRGIVTQFEVKMWIDSDHWNFLLELIRACAEADEIE